MTAAQNPEMLKIISNETFAKFQDLIFEKTGIHMRDGKQILISNRLRKRVATMNLSSYEEYYALLVGKSAAGREEMPLFINAVSTNETYFFREAAHISALRSAILPDIFARRKAIRLWSAGCSTGEEVYTLKIVIDQAAEAFGVKTIQIIGTDINSSVVERAREGVYSGRALRLVAPDVLAKYFTPIGDGAHRVRNEMRKGIEFKVHNLFVDPPPEGAFDIIFCRNVMIYFDKPTQKKLVDEIFYKALHPDGYLCIGHSESLMGTSERFAYAARFKAAVYRVRGKEKK